MYGSALSDAAAPAVVAASCEQIQQAFESALRAAAAVQPPEGKDLQDTEVQRSMAWARRHAAEAELKKQLGGLGLDVSSLSLAPKAAAQANDLLSLARPLAALADMRQ
jgi:hypothetical protein